ncbi:MAG: glutathione peroxidase [Acidobacteria bacterium]|nr:MAG: glutathione peroxidase [Acidobacteriota bacterium]REK01259.1 MAG: glutathione peroxidase [Acidobacteriota bacterium]REK14215.1 MAG: glutathione peroxidase [Acidobacteriota bacterium]REK44930.1 MAG: glutathione peroxidase [Acidobacteriota bacterium]
MRKISGLLIAVLLFAFMAAAYGLGFFNSASEVKAKPVTAKSFYEFEVLDIDGNKVSLSKYKGKVVMFVNTASQCGYTPQYAGLQKIYDQYKDRRFVILGFPANNFNGQEPGTNEEIKEFCTLRYKVTFPMFAKISVKGEDQDPLYGFLTSEKANPDTAGEITWNFNKILADHEGNVIGRFASKETPESPEVTKAIEGALLRMEEPAE